MTGSALGALKAAATRAGVDIDTYDAFQMAGMKRCIKCKTWRDTICFDTDRSRHDGFAAACVYCRRITVRKRRQLPAPSTQTHNAAINAVRTAIRRGTLAKPTALPCFDCGTQAGEYHHFLGYERIHWLDVQALCRSCHQQRHWA